MKLAGSWSVDERSAVGQRYRIIELALPTPVSIRRKASDRGTRKFDWDGSLLRLIVQRENEADWKFI
jgi:hypothetical protein